MTVMTKRLAILALFQILGLLGWAHSQQGRIECKFETIGIGNSDAIVIPCHVLSKDANVWTICLIDTGASNTIVDAVFSKKNTKGQSVSISADGTKARVFQEFHTIVLATVGGPDLHYSAQVGVMAIRTVAPGVGVILGEDFLREYKAVKIDYVHHLLVLEL